MTTQISGDTGVSQVQPGAIDAADFQAALFAASLTGNGYQKLPSGLIIQWGVMPSGVAGGQNITYPIPFPNAVFVLTATVRAPASGTANAAFACWANRINLSTGNISVRFFTAGAFVAASESADWVAIGY